MRALALVGFTMLVAGVTLAQDTQRAPHLPSHAEQLKAIAFLAGNFTGQGANPIGAFRETQVATWDINHTVLTVRTTSTMDKLIVFEDLRVFSFDNDKQAIRMRQWAMGDMITYDVKLDDGKLVCTEIAHEGKGRGEWRYTFTAGKPGFSYALEEKRDGKFAPYVQGTLVPSPGVRGTLEVTEMRAEITIGETTLDAIMFYPKSDAPCPVIVFSPGGQAETTRGYESFARWYATWGFACALVAFDTADAESRAGMYSKVADWLESRNTADGELKGRLDTAKLVAAGHSRGGYAALLAAGRDKRFGHCMAFAPSGPEEWSSELKPTVLLVVGTDDDLLETSRTLYGKLAGPRHLVCVEGMDHFLQPSSTVMQVVSRSTAFLLHRVAGVAAYARWITESESGVEVQAAN